MVINDRSSNSPQLAANAHNIPDDSVDCGIRRLGWCGGPSCQQYARLRIFVVVLACVGLLQGICETYFRISAKQAALENAFNPFVVEWLVVSSGIFQAIFALGCAYWAHRLHPISWLSGIVVLQAVASVIAVIPSIINFSEGAAAGLPVPDDNVCTTSWNQLQKSVLTSGQSKLLTLVLLFVLQLALGMGSVAFYTIGLIYIDDNSKSIDSPAVIATALGAKLLGSLFGSLLSLGVDATKIGWWLGWTIVAPSVFISGILLGLFPRRLPKTVIHQAAQRIIEESDSRQFGSQFSTYIADMAFAPSVRRLFGNKLLMFNLMSIMFIHAAAVNHMLQEESYLQSRFFLPYSEEDGLRQEWRARFVSFFLKAPVAGISMLIAGLAIAKLQLSGRKIAAVNIALNIILLAAYVAFVFVKCDVGPIAGISKGKLQQPYCSRQCICKPTSFLPICPENATVTYFSPCYAGCRQKTTINSIELYEGCTCGTDFEMNTWSQIRATEGACSAGACSDMLMVFQIVTLLAAGVVGMTIIGKIIITLRSVLPQDKGLALAMEITLVGLFTYIPAHLAYDVITRTTCLYWTPEYSKCLLRETPKHGNILNILSASLIFIGIIFDILVFVFIEGLNIYNCKVTDLNYTPSLYSPLPHDDQTQPSTTETETSPVSTTTSTTREPAQPEQPQPNTEITVFRQPSSLTSSSAGEGSAAEATSGITYAQVVLPPDKQKPNDGTSSLKRMAVRADVPLPHLTEQDVRTQLSNLKSFSSAGARSGKYQAGENVPTPLTTAIKPRPVETDLDTIRPQSPETDF